MIKERNDINLTWLSEVMDKCHVSYNVLKINFQILYKTLVARTPIYIFLSHYIAIAGLKSVNIFEF